MKYKLTIPGYNGYKEFDNKNQLKIHIDKLITTHDDLELRITKRD